MALKCGLTSVNYVEPTGGDPKGSVDLVPVKDQGQPQGNVKQK